MNLRDHHQLGIELYQQGRIQEAVHLFAAALWRKESSEVWNDWATAQMACGNPEEAEAGYRRALELSSDNLEAAGNLGVLLARQGRPREAVTFLEQGAPGSTGDEQAQLRSLLADCQARLRELPEDSDAKTLRKYLRQFAGTDPNDLRYFYGHVNRYLGTLAFLPHAPCPGLRALELGAAYHYMSPALIRWKGYGEVRCADVWDGEAQITRRVVRRDCKEAYDFTVDNFDLQCAPWPYADESFDLVLFCEILEHLVSDPMGVMSEINRVLKSGGYLLLTVPNIASAASAVSLLRGEAPYIYGRYEPGGRATDRHNREYAPREVVELAKAAGIDKVRLQTYNSWWCHQSELAALAAQGCPVALRGDTIFFFGRKASPVRDRYPLKFYELEGTQQQRRVRQGGESGTSGPAATPSAKGLRILVIHEILPQYDRSGSEQRHCQLLRILRAQGHAVTYIARNGQDLERYVPALEELGITVYAHDAERLRSLGIEARPQWLLEEVLEDGKFDVVFLLHWFWSGISVPEHYLTDIRRLSPHTRVIVLSDDPHGPRESALAELSGQPGDWERAKDYEQREIEVYRQADFVVTVSETNRRALLNLAPELDIEVLPNEAESMATASSRPGFEARRDLLFLGDFSNLANRDGLEWFLEQAWPLVRRKLPAVRFFLAGSNMPEVYANQHGGVVCLGFVEDLESLLNRHRVFISPARYGLSTRTKNLNALAHGLPLVTTPIGAEGLNLRHGREAMLAVSPEGFAAAVARLYSEPDLWKTVAEQGRAHIRREFSEQRLTSRTAEVLDRTMAISPRPYDPTYVWSAMRVEQRYPGLLQHQPARDRMMLRCMCYLRMAERLLAEGQPARAREQLRHIFSFVRGTVPRNPVFISALLRLESCYRALDEAERADKCREAGQACVLPPPHAPAHGGGAPHLVTGRERPEISVIIPTFNRQRTLTSCLRALDGQRLPPRHFEVIVIDDGSSDGTGDFCRTFSPEYRFQYFQQSNAGPGAARRLGVEKARGKYLLLFNDDTIASPELLAEHLRVLKQNGHDRSAVLGDFRYPPAASSRALTYFLATNPFLFPQMNMEAGAQSKNAYFIASNLSIRRSAVLEAGSFDPRFQVAEDTELGVRLRRAGYQVVYDPLAWAWHDHLSFTTRDLIRRAQAYGATQYQLLRKHPHLLGDGEGFFGLLDEASAVSLAARAGALRGDIPETVRALEKFDELDFLPFFGLRGEAGNSAREVMELFEKALPAVFWFHLWERFLEVWAQDLGQSVDEWFETARKKQEVEAPCPR